MYGARTAMTQICVIVCKVASQITKWSADNDRLIRVDRYLPPAATCSGDAKTEPRSAPNAALQPKLQRCYCDPFDRSPKLLLDSNYLHQNGLNENGYGTTFNRSGGQRFFKEWSTRRQDSACVSFCRNRSMTWFNSVGGPRSLIGGALFVKQTKIN
jgi:hypothetical protein